MPNAISNILNGFKLVKILLIANHERNTELHTFRQHYALFGCAIIIIIIIANAAAGYFIFMIIISVVVIIVVVVCIVIDAGYVLTRFHPSIQLH